MEVQLRKAERQMRFEETELRLGMPGNNGGGTNAAEGEAARKRGFSETEPDTSTTHEAADTVHVDLMLNLSSKAVANCKDPVHDKHKIKPTTDLANGNKHLPAVDPAKPPAKAQVVGWPPVRSYRKNILGCVQKNKMEEISEKAIASFVKVSMDGAPYLRKVDLKMFNSYQQLSHALCNMFSSFTINGNCGRHGMKDLMKQRKLMDLLDNSDYVPTYEDKDGDWMLLGDVPWEMFVESCKRLRIMEGSDAIGLAPKAMEKCKNRS